MTFDRLPRCVVCDQLVRIDQAFADLLYRRHGGEPKHAMCAAIEWFVHNNDGERFCEQCGADIVGNDPHEPGCPADPTKETITMPEITDPRPAHLRGLSVEEYEKAVKPDPTARRVEWRPEPRCPECGELVRSDQATYELGARVPVHALCGALDAANRGFAEPLLDLFHEPERTGLAIEWPLCAEHEAKTRLVAPETARRVEPAGCIVCAALRPREAV